MQINTIWNRIEKWFALNAPPIFAALNAGATEEQIQQTEKFLGIQLPNDVHDSYIIHNGQRTNISNASGILDSREFLSLERIIEHWMVPTKLFREHYFAEWQGDSQGEVRPDWWNPKWIPLTHDGLGNYYCLDLDPAPDGISGQIITVWHDSPERDVIAESFTEWLAEFADELEKGLYVFSDQDGGIVHIDDL